VDQSKKTEFRAYLDGIGEQQARALLARGGYPPDQTAEAEGWLHERELSRLAEASAPAIRIATSAKDIARASMIIAIVAIIVSALIPVLLWWFPRH
jgi:hypothetical protein